MFVNNRRERVAAKTVRAHARIDVFVDEKRLLIDEKASDREFTMSADQVLYEDDYLIAVDKPPGLPTHYTVDTARANLVAKVKEFLRQRDGSAEPYLGTHQRLDRDTSGVILFTKDTAANSGLAEAFAAHKITKIYHAITQRPAGRRLTTNWSVAWDLPPVAPKGKKVKEKAVTPKGVYALTDFTLLEEFVDALLIEARPHTGRTHQIRAHLSQSGMPIHGDKIYGGQLQAVDRLMLHAKKIVFTHPITDHELSIESPWPADFQSAVSALRKKLKR